MYFSHIVLSLISPKPTSERLDPATTLQNNTKQTPTVYVPECIQFEREEIKHLESQRRQKDNCSSA